MCKIGEENKNGERNLTCFLSFPCGAFLIFFLLAIFRRAAPSVTELLEDACKNKNSTGAVSFKLSTISLGNTSAHKDETIGNSLHSAARARDVAEIKSLLAFEIG